MTPDSFWHSTPREIGYVVDAETNRRKLLHQQMVAGAWYTSALARQKRLPRLESLLRDKPKAQTVVQQIASVANIVHLFGGKDLRGERHGG